MNLPNYLEYLPRWPHRVVLLVKTLDQVLMGLINVQWHRHFLSLGYKRNLCNTPVIIFADVPQPATIYDR